MKKLFAILALIGATINTQAQYIENEGTISVDAYSNNYTKICYILPFVTGKPFSIIGKVYLVFDYIDTETGCDVVTVSDDENTKAKTPSLGLFSGLTVPKPIYSNTQGLWINFASNGSITRSGFKARYYKCTDIFTSDNGTISVQGASYQNNMINRWLIAPTNALGIKLSFTSFNLELGKDYVRVYDGDPSSPSLIGEFTGTNLPTASLYSSSNMTVVFTSNESTSYPTNTGFSANFEKTPSTFDFIYDVTGNCISRPVLGGGLKSYTIQNNFSPDDLKNNADQDKFIKLYPNPTKGKLTVEFTTFANEVPGSLSITDINGRLVYYSNVLKKVLTIDLSNKASGQYILKYENGDNNKSWKIIKD